MYESNFAARFPLLTSPVTHTDDTDDGGSRTQGASLRIADAAITAAGFSAARTDRPMPTEMTQRSKGTLITAQLLKMAAPIVVEEVVHLTCF